MRTLERPMPTAMACKRLPKSNTKVASKPEIASEKIPKTIHGCIVESHEFTRQGVESSQPQNHEDHIAGKGFTSMSHKNLARKIIFTPRVMKILGAKAAVDKELTKLETIPAWNLERSRKSEKGGYSGRTKTQKSPLCHTHGRMSPQKYGYGTKITEVQRHSRAPVRNCKRRPMQFFTEQGSSASQMTAAKLMDVIARLSCCDGQASDAVSAYTQVKMEDAPKLLKIPKSECPDMCIRLPRHKWPKSWANIEDPVVHLGRNLYGHHWLGCYGKDNSKKRYYNMGGSTELGMYVRSSKTEVISQFMWLTSKWLERSRKWNMASCMFGCTQRECKPNEIIIDRKQRCLKHVFLLEQQKITRLGKNLTRKL